MNDPDADVVATPTGASWTKQLRASTIVAIVVIALVLIFAGLIPPLLVFILLWLVGVVWLRRSTKGPAILLLASFVAYLLLSAPFIIPTLTVPASAGDFILNVASVLAAFVGIVAAVQVVRGQLGSSSTAATLGKVAVGVFVVGVVGSLFATMTYDDAEAQEGDIELSTKDNEFVPESLAATGGEVSVFVDNADGTLHTFTIEELDVNLDIPASKSARVTFEAPSGTYEFVCVPHAQEGMTGTLVVE